MVRVTCSQRPRAPPPGSGRTRLELDGVLARADASWPAAPAAPRPWCPAEEQEQVRHEQPVLVHRGDVVSTASKAACPWRNTARYSVRSPTEISARAARAGHEEVAGVEGRRGEPAQARCPSTSGAARAAVLAEELLEQRAVAPQHRRPQPEELHLLHVGVAGDDPLQVVEPAPVGGAPRVEPEGLGGQPRLGDERGHRRDHEHQHPPPGHAPQQHREGGQRDQVAHDRDAGSASDSGRVVASRRAFCIMS